MFPCLYFVCLFVCICNRFIVKHLSEDGALGIYKYCNEIRVSQRQKVSLQTELTPTSQKYFSCGFVIAPAVKTT